MNPNMRGIALRIIENASRNDAISVSVKEGAGGVAVWSIMVVSG
jgi:hypothetical protein